MQNTTKQLQSQALCVHMMSMLSGLILTLTHTAQSPSEIND